MVVLQVMLKQDSGEYACIAEDKVRYNLGDVKEELMAAMGLNTGEHLTAEIAAAAAAGQMRLLQWWSLDHKGGTGWMILTSPAAWFAQQATFHVWFLFFSSSEGSSMAHHVMCVWC
jgi:hypothetical protein